MSRLAVLSGSSVLQAAANAVAALIATQALGPQERGLMVLGLTVGSIYGLVGGLGSGPAFRSQLPCAHLPGAHLPGAQLPGAQLPGARQPAARRNLVTAFTWCTIAGTLLATAAAVATVAVSAAWIDPALRSVPFLAATASCTVAQVLLAQVPDGWFADGRFRRGALGAAAMGAGGLAGVLATLTVSSSAASVLCGQALGMLVVGVAEVAALRRADLIGLAGFELAQVLSLLRAGVPALGLTVGLAVALRADRYLLGAVAGAAAVGIYSLAATLSEVSRLLPASLGQLYLRDASTRLGAARLEPTIRFAIVSAVACGLIVAAGGWMLIVPVFGGQFAPARELLMVLIVAEVCLAPYSVASRGLLGGGWTTAAGLLGIAGSLVALAAYAMSAVVAGAMGVATGSVAVYAGLSFVSYRMLRRRVGSRPQPVGSG